MLGWREWGALPTLGLPALKIKVDTGARTSALHAFNLEPFTLGSQNWLRFHIHPLQCNTDLVILCKAPIKDQRQVSDSGGHRELRYVIETELVLGPYQWPIELTLTDRDSMSFRMLLGRRAMAPNTIVNPSASYLMGKLNSRRLYHQFQS
jgi:hypothetical protein